jgi:hypothetical protein
VIVAPPEPFVVTAQVYGGDPPETVNVCIPIVATIAMAGETTTPIPTVTFAVAVSIIIVEWAASGDASAPASIGVVTVFVTCTTSITFAVLPAV